MLKKLIILASLTYLVHPVCTAMTYRNYIDNSYDVSIVCFDRANAQRGSISLTINQKDPSQGYIRNIFVQQPYRNQKIGSHLLHCALKHMKEHNVTTIYLDALGSKHFFLKHGAEPLESTNPEHLMLDLVPMKFDLTKNVPLV